MMFIYNKRCTFILLRSVAEAAETEPQKHAAVNARNLSQHSRRKNQQRGEERRRQEKRENVS